MYYNTNNESGEELQASRRRATSQTAIILSFFLDNPEREFTPFQVQTELGLQAPITSIRRAISDLTDEGQLEKTNTLRPGLYGKKCHCWTAKKTEA